jgi:hypothetical protein
MKNLKLFLYVLQKLSIAGTANNASKEEHLARLSSHVKALGLCLK